MINNRVFLVLCTLLFSVFFSTNTWATYKDKPQTGVIAVPINPYAAKLQRIADASNSQAIIGETKGAHQCCAPNGISYCDISSGHYVCSDGGYSTCICQSTTPVTTYATLMLDCCLWHGGIAANNLGIVVCNDGSVSEVCSIQSANLTAFSSQQ